MRQYQTTAENIMHQHDSVDMTFTMTGNSQFLSSNQGILLAFLKEPGERPPIQMPGPDGQMKTIKHPSIDVVSGQIMGQLGQGVKGAFSVFTPQPVLQISTGATNRSGGQFAFSLSGIDPNEVYS